MSPARDIPSLDGIRAVSISVVILAHSHWYLPSVISNSALFRAAIGNGQNGVAFFFVISGFLITTLLLRELDRTGVVSLRRFYLRRTLRIFPPYYLFISVMAILWLERVIPENGASFLAASTYTWALDPKAEGYFLTHTWSLSVEEIFYLIWPLAVMRLRSLDNLRRLSIALIFFMPFVRLAFYFVFPTFRGHEFYMIYGWADTMMAGCWLALFRPTEAFERFRKRYVRGWIAAILCLIAFYVNPLLIAHLSRTPSNAWRVLVSPSIVLAAVVLTVCYAVENSGSILGRLLNSPLMRSLGVISYSLYLWQQLFMSERLHLLPWGYVAALAAALVSYFLIEKPSFALRAVLEARFSPLKVKPASRHTGLA